MFRDRQPLNYKVSSLCCCLCACAWPLVLLNYINLIVTYSLQLTCITV